MKLDAAAFRRYWNETRRPLVCLMFVLPLLVLYEAGVWAFPDAPRNGADVWMRGWLGVLGLGSGLVLPVVIVGVLLAWHHGSRQPWKVPRGVLLGMLGESILIGMALRLLGSAFAPLLSAAAPGDKHRIALAVEPAQRLMQQVIEYVGAGIYEETLFRLLLLPALIAMFAYTLPRPRAILLAVVVSSLMFAGAHHLGAHGEAFRLSVFLFRTVAGMLFAAIFLYRGFGVATGAHAVYDIVTGVVAW
ncbi:CAAX amino terminal protease self- immunity [Posidoniimonas corsicana]|uniref:CAAX amino terminal protease self-immunity n=1 Tax=Posidoniimonas corsicana TaxID=1938618 RepID=A0A5C5UXP7_9BACT|nr:CPBP family glutamic-type intramembrane protease [Posidoniimonas corsicana]TWT30297.1 CAAX amino terminal protease self- immunity [Posidoniimonas corsicana]